MTTTDSATARASSRPPRPGAPRRTVPAALYPLAAVVLTAAASLVRAAVNPRFYYRDDTQTGAFGQWYEVGSMLLEGRWTLLSPHAWQAGNYLAEGQWALLSPLQWAIGLGSHVLPDAVAYSTLVKVVLLSAMALGVYLLARSFGADRGWALVAGVSAPLAGFTSYMDAPSWVSGLITTMLLPFAWWGLRRTVLQRANPLPFLIATYLLVASGYVFGTVVFAAVLLATWIQHLVARERREARVVFAGGVYTLLLTVAVYLPSVLTAPVTDRGSSSILNDNFLNVDLTDLITVTSPTATTSINGWWGLFPSAPIQYIAWFLPLLVPLLPLLRRAWRPLLPLLVMLGLNLFLVMAPAYLGPLRFPVRMLPYVAVATVVLFAVLATGNAARLLARRSLVTAAGVMALVALVAWTQRPEQLPSQGLGLIAGLIGLAVLDRLRPVLLPTPAAPATPPASSGAGSRAGRIALLAPAFAVATALIVVPQTLRAPASPLGDYSVPGTLRELAAPLDGVPDDVIVAGNTLALRLQPDAYAESGVANTWYVTGRQVANTYTVLPFSAFSRDLCMGPRGETCPAFFRDLFREDPETGLPLADLLSVNTVLMIKDRAVQNDVDQRAPAAPDGWGLVREGDYTATYVRDETVAEAGGVVWASDGVEVAVTEETDTGVSFTVEALPADGGAVTFSRLAWPGYTVAGAALAEPLRDYLLTVDLSGAEVGDQVTVGFRPPGWLVALPAFLMALAGLVAWPVLHEVRRRGSRDARRGGTGPS